MIDNQMEEFTKEDTEFLYKIVEALMDDFGETLGDKVKEEWYDTERSLWDHYSEWFLDHLQKRLDELCVPLPPKTQFEKEEDVELHK